MISRETSLRLDILRFPLIVGVVFIHNYEVSVTFQGGQVGALAINDIVDFVRNLISQGIARVAVPLFFLMSGYLFFLKFESTLAGYFRKLKTRLRTLLLPLVFWNLVMLAVIALAQYIPQTSSFFSGRNAVVAQFNAFDVLDAIFGIDRAPIAYQFWFVRDLLVLVLFSPLVWLLCRFVWLPWLLGAAVWWFWGGWPLAFPAIDALLFFSVGSWFAISKRDVFFFDFVGPMCAAFYALLCIADALLYGSSSGAYVHKVAIIFGMVTALWLTGLVLHSESLTATLVRLGQASFFVFAAHEPLLTICKKLVFHIFQPQSSFFILGIYFVLPVLVIALIVFIYPRMRALFPGFMSMISGGR